MGPESNAASWHPALMPNSDAHRDEKLDSARILQQAAAKSQSEQPHHIDDEGQEDEDEDDEEEEDEEDEDEDEHEGDTHNDTLGQSGSNHGAVLDQFNAEQDPHAGPGDLSQSAAQPEVTNNTPEQPSISKLSNHTSRMSFARTVSQPLDFHDDDDTDFNLQRTDTDPFKFMPPSDRTNSFPVVPAPTTNRSRATSQAQEIIQDLEDEEDEEHEDSFAHAGASTAFETDDTTTHHQADESSFRPAVGGDIAGTDAAGARFEEGIPLIAQEDEEESEEEEEESEEEDEEPKAAQPANLFGEDEDADEGDDFFSQVKDQSEQAAYPPALQRKSTMAAIGSMAGPDEDDELPSPSEQGPSRNLTEEPAAAIATTGEKPADLDAKWAAAFGDDDDDEFLADNNSPQKELDPADIFGSDDEGFLDDDDDVAAGAPTTPQVDSVPFAASTPNDRYAPAANAQQQRPAPNPYAPGSVSQTQIPQATPYSLLPQSATAPALSVFNPTPPRPEVSKAQSFADKAKGGYQSPYDLPMDIVKQPKKRPSVQQMSRPSTSGSMGPPTGLGSRTASMQSQGPPMGASLRRDSNQSVQDGQRPPALKPSSSGFFEDLPMAPSRSRPASRSSYAPPGHGQLSPQEPPMISPNGPLAPSAVMQPLPAQAQAQRRPSETPSLIAPEMLSPYAALQASPEQKAAVPATNRYSPAPVPNQNGSVVPPAAASRYSPAPPGSRASSGAYGAVASGIPPPILAAHQPRTSSPLAHFEVTREGSRNRMPSPAHSDAGGAPLVRTNSNQYEPRQSRIHSLPTTQEVEEETSAPPPLPTNLSSPQLRYTNMEARGRTPPPVGLQPSMLSPPKRTAGHYTPQTVASPAKEVNFAPPPRSQAGSPGFGRHSQKSSAGYSVTSPPLVQSPPETRPTVRARGMSVNLNLVPPTDGRELDQLQRWKGCPVFSWGVGGTFVTSFPKDVPRYGIQSAVPQIVRSPGEVKLKHVKDVQSLDERLAKFPGPLKGKSKKKETVAWLTTAIESLEQQAPSMGFQHYVSHEDKRIEERILLYKILKVFIENDGVLEGNAVVDKAVREIISPAATATEESTLSSGADLGTLTSSMTTMQADAVDSSAIEQIRKFLLSGEREKAAWLAVDRRLWGHALLLANTVQTADLYKKVTQEFIKKEVNHPGHNNESLAALYGVLSGNYEESVDELVPSHARAGLQLMSTSATAADNKDALAGLDKWRETLGLILSNRSLADVQALGSLGNLLSSYGRAEAAHICYLFARQHVVFGGLDDPNAQFVLVGADHQRQADQFAKETEALLLSEVFEYGLSMTGGTGCPHLAAYKLQHALILAQYGFRDKALQYCDAIYNAISSQTKRSAYYNSALESAVDDLMKRLKQAPKEESSSWITKPTMNQVSSGMWNRFNKFVAGDDGETQGDGAAGDLGVESGPFARVAGGTPTISRSPSVTDFGAYSTSPVATSIPSMHAAATKASSRYAPGAAQPVTSPYDPNGFTTTPRTSSDMPRSPYDPAAQANGNPYAPQTPTSSYQPAAASVGTPGSPYAPAQTTGPPAETPAVNPYSGYGGYEPYTATPTINEPAPAPEKQPQAAPDSAPAETGYQAPSYGYEPPSTNSYSAPTLNTFDSSEGGAESGAASGGYEPPSYQPSTFEAPSYEPGPEATNGDDDDEAPKPKKKSFMDLDDEDDYPSVKPQEKTKAERDRESDERVRKIAEAEAKAAAEAKASKKGGWGFGGWFGAGKKDANLDGQPKAIKAKLGEQSSFVYDPDLKRWVNKKAGAEDTVARAATPPPPRATPPPATGGMAPPPPSMSAPPMGMGPPGRNGTPPPPMLGKKASTSSLAPPGVGDSPGRPMTLQSSASEGANVAGSGAAPPRPASRLSNASSIDDLLGAAGPRKAGKKPRKSGRYIDVMAK